MATLKIMAIVCAFGLLVACGAERGGAAPVGVGPADATALVGVDAATCGNGLCETGEAVACPGDCAAPPAGCQSTETPGCGGCACGACVCALDPYCCATAWDGVCVSECSADCGMTCPGSDVPGCAAKATPGCGGCGCESCVCAADAYCCATAWDSLCVGACQDTCGMACTPVAAVCGDGACQAGEDVSCPADCQIEIGCLGEKCGGALQACRADAGCAQVAQCVAVCGADVACAQTCVVAAAPAPLALFQAMFACHAQNCLLDCVGEKCQPALQACQVDVGCAALAQCATGCGADFACQQACQANAAPTAKPLFTATAQCAALACPLALPATADVKVQINPDVGDPHLFTVKGGGTTTWVFGTKSPEGAPQGIEKAIVDTGKEVSTLQFDAAGRPTGIADSGGRSMTFSYSDTDLTIVFKGPDGVGETQIVPLAKLPADFPKPAPGGFASAGQGLSPGDRPITVVTHVRIVQDGKVLQSLVDAQVVATISNKTLKYPGAFDPAQDGYTFLFVHRTLELDHGKADCLARFGTAADLATYLGGIAAIATTVCLFTPGAPICAYLAAKGTTLALSGLGVGGALSTLKSKTCDDLVIPPDPNQVTVTVAVQHPAFGAGAGSGSYDLGSALDPVNKTSKLEIFVDYPVKAAILAIATVPAKPAAKQSYQFRFDYLPPGADIEWKLTGTDRFATSGVASGGATGTTALTKFIPGGAQGIQDTVEAWLVIAGQKLHFQTWNFTFQ